MTSKLKKLKDLERQLNVTIPLDDYNLKFENKINNIKSKAKLDGFRKGKVPNDVLKQKYGSAVHGDVLNELIQESYPMALTENKLRPASSPKITIENEDPSKPITYSAVFEIFPDIKIKFSRWKNYEKYSIKVNDDDLDKAIEDIKKRYGTWSDKEGKAEDGDQVTIDFKGKIEGNEFEGNSANDFQLILGSKSMIPGFEDSIIGKDISKFEINATFPDDYFKKDLAGKASTFEINLTKIQKQEPAKLDKELFEKLDIKTETEDGFKEEIHKRMTKEVALQEKDLTKESIYKTLLDINKFLAPQATIQEQADLMRKDALMRMGRSVEEAPDDLFPTSDFNENAEKRVKLDLLFAELVKHYDLKVEKQDLDNLIDEEAKKYKDADQFKGWIQSQPQQLDQFRMIALEKLLIEKLEIDLKSKDKVVEFSELATIK